jgi:ferric-dicitrate binding protein FerR (iron transport regulator)
MAPWLLHFLFYSTLSFQEFNFFLLFSSPVFLFYTLITMTDRLSYLFQLYIDRGCTPEEHKELMGLALQEDLQEELKRLIEIAWEQTGRQEDMSEEKAAEFLSGLFAGRSLSTPAPVRKLHFRKWAVAAAVAALLLAGFWMFGILLEPKSKDVTAEQPVQDVAAPDKNRAFVTLANGSIVYLDSVGNGELASQGMVKLRKNADGEIVYEASSDGANVNDGNAPLAFNTLNNPRGSRVLDMTLSDGSRVWLNAGSSLTYPVQFTGEKREVSITGEAYFEVSTQLHNGSAKMPFVVSKGKMSITVLGTHFNVNAYEDENDIKVTLLEGKVSVSGNLTDPQGALNKLEEKSVVLQPGQQAIVSKQYAISTASSVDVESVIAWKSGFFSFRNADLPEVMRQIARWYDVEISYEGQVPNRRFGGEISRMDSISKVLRVLEESKVKFRIEGKRVTILR